MTQASLAGAVPARARKADQEQAHLDPTAATEVMKLI
jgi:hypothetical protein